MLRSKKKTKLLNQQLLRTKSKWNENVEKRWWKNRKRKLKKERKREREQEKRREGEKKEESHRWAKCERTTATLIRLCCRWFRQWSSCTTTHTYTRTQTHGGSEAAGVGHFGQTHSAAVKKQMIGWVWHIESRLRALTGSQQNTADSARTPDCTGTRHTRCGQSATAQEPR